MKKLFGIVILILAAMTVHAGGGSEPQTANSSPQSATTAAQLATALNAMNSGSARASGNTVTLTRNVGIQRNLTVPAGVTLELTADGGLYLRDNVTLTVNGTVNAPSNKIGTDDEGGRTAPSVTINGNGTINLTSKGQLLGIWGGDGVKRKLTLDGVTLVGIADNDESLVIVSEGGELVLVSGAITGNTRTDDDWANGGGVNVWRGTFIMEGGEISGNSAVGTRGSGGGGASVGGGSVFTMSGGEISGNSAVNAGGVFIEGNGNTFIMKGGVIFGNTVTRYGGGVMIQGSGSTFIMEGGRIQGGTDSDGFTKNTATLGYVSLAVNANYDTVKWGTGGTYTKGGVNQTGGGNIGDTSDTLIAIP